MLFELSSGFMKVEESNVNKHLLYVFVTAGFLCSTLNTVQPLYGRWGGGGGGGNKKMEGNGKRKEGS